MIRKIFILSITLLLPCLGYGEEYKDRIIAVVNDKVILQSEVQNAIDNLTQDEITKEFSTGPPKIETIPDWIIFNYDITHSFVTAFICIYIVDR